MSHYSFKTNSNSIPSDISPSDTQEYTSRLQALKKEFMQNHKENQKIASIDKLEGFEFCYLKPKNRYQQPKVVKKGLKTSASKTKHHNRKTGAPIPSMPVHENPKAWTDAILHDDEDVLHRLMGPTVSVQDYLPQQLVVKRDRPVRLGRIKALAFAEAALGIQKDILLDETVTLEGGTVVGLYYLVMLTVLHDLLKAMRNEITIFEDVTPFYNYVRNFLTPRKCDQYSYDWTNVPDMSTLLNDGVGFKLPEPGFDTVSLAWLTGTFNALGQAELVNTIPVLSVLDLETSGVQATTKLWKRILQQSEGSIDLIEPFEDPRSCHSAAAFAIPRDIGTDDYNGYLTMMSEVSIPESHYFMSAVRLVDRGDPSVVDVRGKFIYRTYSGSASYNWRLMNQDVSSRTFIPKPRQVPLTAYLLQALTILLQSDLVDKDVETKDAVSQPSDSFLSNVTCGDFLVSIISFVLKRYAMNNFLMLGTDSINKDVFKIGVGMQYIIDYGGVINGLMPLFMTEGMASLNLKPVKVAPRKYELMIPYIVMTGTKTHADPTGNSDLADPNSVVSLLSTMYTFVDPNMSTYQFNGGLGGNQIKTFDISVPNTSFLFGPSINDAILQINLLMGRIQGNADTGVALGNIHTEPYTLADYSYFCTPFDSTTDWDDATQSRAVALTSVIPIDPNYISDELTRILPVVYGTDNEAYVAMTGETTSLKLDINFAKQLIVSAAANVHEVAGIGNETAIADRSIVARGGGGGVMDFLKKAGKAAVPVISLLLGQLGDAYAPGSGALIRQIGSSVTGLIDASEPPSQFVRGIMKQGYKHPHAVIFRPLSSIATRGSSRYHVTHRPDYY